jgi:aerobic-type carbon monoxide dehydrogenase small subunit (CoxS/CutS family)
MSLTVNGTAVPLPGDPRVSLLDLLRDHAGLPGTKKGCNQGACGACTVLVDGERILLLPRPRRAVRGARDRDDRGVSGDR